MRPYFFILIMLIFVEGASGQVGINNPIPHASAALDVTSVTQGFLPPRMTIAQRDDIDSPAEGLVISCTNCNVPGLHQYNNGKWQALMAGSTGNYGIVVNPTTGKVWLDRNLGATQVATSSMDADSYGDLYQWGRGADGHQLRSSGTTTTQATNWLAGSGVWINSFITTSLSPFNWLSLTDTHMWTGTAAENNPCPSGFRLPTNAEWEQERRSWSINNSVGAFASPLKLPLAGFRNSTAGLIGNTGNSGYYWSSTINDTSSRFIYISNSESSMYESVRAYGYSVRCIKD